MDVVVVNLTTESLYVSTNSASPSDIQEKLPRLPSGSHCSIAIEKARPKWLHCSIYVQHTTDDHLSHEIHAKELRLTRRRNWKRISSERCPWRIYVLRRGKSKSEFILILLSRSRYTTSNFLSYIEDDRLLCDLCLPGTHDTMALYGWPISQCQSLSTPLDVQLRSGIRVLDVRLAVVDDKLIAYHGAYPQKTSFQTIISIIHAFLTAPDASRETIVMSLKQEDFSRTPPPHFSKLVRAEIEAGAGGMNMWFLKNRVPRLGEVRSKVVMFSRFGGDGAGWDDRLEGMGIHPTTWPDSRKEGFEWTCKNTVVRTHDWYSIPSFLEIPEKVQLATAVLLRPPQHRSTPMLNITYLSAGSFPLALPPTVACGFGWPAWGMGVEGVNSRAVQWLLEQLSNVHTNPAGKGTEMTLIRGWAFMDFYESTAELVPLFIEFNFFR